jgi:competence protein ComEC
LVPAALIAWTVTAAGIVWSLGALLAAGCVIGAAGWAVLVWWRGATTPALRAAAVAVIGTAVIGAGFGLAAALRDAAVRGHPITHRFGTTASLTVTPTESPRSLGNGRLMFCANLNRLGDGEMSGRVVVFAPVLGFSELTAGQPAGSGRASVVRPAET